ncbi:anhydro-N-acetylmuramic acid kinase [Oceanobacillus salinisoli]|uniref:anhydro-N-acetylmuramic acid kinase n=1 Tax=Oceanobacillus salinisoli TaxID=2678611 RepID=UPI0012E246D5|nr:anhydro-N-acetylmuramic acid kinase [Oceanobacillus salinisoli]
MVKTRGIGLMSGTSLDGIDAVIVDLVEKDGKVDVQLIDSLTSPYSEELRQELMEVCTPAKATIQKISSLNIYLGKELGQVVNNLLKQAGIKKEEIQFVSSHGQTIYHQPFLGESVVDVPGTLQIGDLSVLSEETGIGVVGDFRTADMAAGGQGAPLVSYVDYILFQSANKSRALQNIGGIGNVTYLGANASGDDVLSFDTGPGNMVIDEIVFRVTKGKWHYDKGGLIAYKGKINQSLLSNLLSHDYFFMEPPKTTGRELFGKMFVDEIFKGYGYLPEAELVATVTDWTAVSIAQGYQDFLIKKGKPVDEVIVSGGGSNNPYLIERLKKHLAPIQVYTLEDFGMSSDLKEAIAFAVLGYQCIRGNYNQLPSATGATQQVIMGKTAYTNPDSYERLNRVRRV